MSVLTVVTLVLVLLLPDGGARTTTREFRGEDALGFCKQAEQSARSAVKLAGDAIDVGTICVVSEFDPAIRPPA